MKDSHESLDTSSNKNVIKFITLLVFSSLIFIWTLVKLVFAYICHKYKCQVKFKFSRIYQLKNINIIKHLADERLVHLSIGKFFISSCYVNRNINDRLLVCLSNVVININSNDYCQDLDDKVLEPKQINNNNQNSYYYTTKLFNYILLIFFKYFASLRIDDVIININQNKQQIVTLDLPQLEIKFDKTSNQEIIESKLSNFNLTYMSNLVILNIKVAKVNLMLKTGNKLLDIIEKIEIKINEGKLTNQLSLNDLSHLIPLHNGKNQSSSGYFLFAKKLKLIKIKNFIYNLNNRDDNNECSDDLIKLDELNILNNESLFLRNLDYFKQGRFNYSLLDKIEILLIKRTELYFILNDSNFYIQLDLLDRLLALYNKLILNYSVKNESSNNSKFYDKFKLVTVKLTNFYLNLIHEKSIYTFGSSLLNLDLNRIEKFASETKDISFNTEYFVIFKSNLEINSQLEFQNNLFYNRQNIRLSSIFNKIRFKCNNNNKNFHYWGTILSLRNFNANAKIVNNSKLKLNLNVENLLIEYLPDILKSLLGRLNTLFTKFKQFGRNYDSLNINHNHSIKVNVKSAYFYYLYQDIYLISMSFNNFTLMNINANRSLMIEKISCLEFSTDEIRPIRENILDNKYLNMSLVESFREEDENELTNSDQATSGAAKNYNLLFLVKLINLTNLSNEYYLCINDILLTWSLQIHFIFYDTIVKPFDQYKSLIELITNSDNFQEKSNINLNILIESNILINFLFDYQQDSSKIVLPNSNNLKEGFGSCATPYFNTAHPTNSLIHTVSIILNSAYFYKQSDTCRAKINDVSVLINVDDQNIFSILNEDSCILHSTSKLREFLKVKQIDVNAYSPEKSLLKFERQLLNTEQKNNRLVSINFDFLNLNFLFNYDFAKLFDHLLNLRKCLYIIHDIRSKQQISQESNLISSDLLIKIKQFQLVIEDDPFEVRLAYNYALMTDEYFESVKRRQTLEQRRSIREQNLELEALEILRERESKIYLQRSKMIYQSNENKNSNNNNHTRGTVDNRSIRTELFCFCIDNFEFFALADSSWHTRQQCYEILRKIDHCSPPPPPPSSISSIIALSKITNDFNPANQFLTLFCRHINLKAEDFRFLFRDYTQPLLKMNKLNLMGKFLGSEYTPSERAKRDIKIGVGNELPNTTFLIQRSMSPFKIYYDLNTKIELFEFAYGPCWEGCMAQLNLSLDKIIHPARDPSRPMPWWDKCRLYLHGRLTSLIQQSQTIYHVSMDPYNHTEEMKWVWSDLYFDFSDNSKILFKGILDVYLNTESKYDDIRLLHMPLIEMKIDLDWICKAQQQHSSLKKYLNKNLLSYNLAKAHNFVSPCAPDKLPVIINSCEHDSFSQFRSENVNINISIVCKYDKAISSQQLPTCKFYASTSRFLQRIKTLLSAITRPTKRGKLFLNRKPRKPILSRHFKQVHIHLDIPKLKILYWSSASEEYGCQFELESFLLNSTQRLELIPFMDTLKRRPKPCWFIEMMAFNLSQATIYLMSPMAGSAIKVNSKAKATINGSVPNQAELDLLTLNERPINLLETPAALRNFFLQVDSIFYERHEKNIYEYNSYDKTKQYSSNEANKKTSSSSCMKNLKRSFKLYNKKNLSIDDLNDSTFSLVNSSVRRKSNHLDVDAFKLSDISINNNASMTSLLPFQVKNMPKHNLLVRNLKAKWNNINRDVLHTLYEIYNKSKRLRHNLSSQALKQFDIFTGQMIENERQLDPTTNIPYNYYIASGVNNTDALDYSTITSNRMDSYISKLSSQQHLGPNKNSNFKHFQSNNRSSVSANLSSNQPFEDLLRKLDSERGINSEIYCNENETIDSSNFNNMLYGIHATEKMHDLINENVFIEFINSQVKLSLEDPNNLKINEDNIKNKEEKSKEPLFNEDYSNETSKNDCKEYLIISAARTNVVQRLHKPVWKSQRLLDKTSWSGCLENMQYVATLNDSMVVEKKTKKSDDNPKTNIDELHNRNEEYWLRDDIIDAHGTLQSLNDSFLKSDRSSDSIKPQNKKRNKMRRKSLGMLISYKYQIGNSSMGRTKKTSQPKNEEISVNKQKRGNLTSGLILARKLRSNKKLAPQQQSEQNQNESMTDSFYYNQRNLQLIASKCRCEFYMIDFDDKLPNSDEKEADINNMSTLNRHQSLNSNVINRNLNENNNSPNQHLIDLNGSFNEPIDCFTLIHSDLNLCTNSKQYKMIMDLVNNLVLYFRPRRKQVIDKQKSIKFNLQLSMGNLDSLKQHIQFKQIEAKQLLCNLRLLERKLYHLREKIELEIANYNQNYNLNLMKSQTLENNISNNQIYVIQELRLENKAMEKEYRECKRMLNELSDELNISISCYKEMMFEKRALNLANTPQFVQNFTNASNYQINQNNYFRLKSYLLPPMLVNLSTNSTNSMNRSFSSSFIKLNNLNSNNQIHNNSEMDQQQAKNEIENEILNNEIGRRYEVWFKCVQWKLNDDDGKKSLAKFLMKNFLYTKVTNQTELDCVEHNLEIESCKVQDLTNVTSTQKTLKKHATPSLAAFNVLTSLFDEANFINEFESDSFENDNSDNDKENYSDEYEHLKENDDYLYVSDTEDSEVRPEKEENMYKNKESTENSTIKSKINPSNSQMVMFRIFCKERPPVGSIPVFEHLELNVSPLLIKFTNRFYNMMLRFFFENNQNNSNQVFNATTTNNYYLLSNNSSMNGLSSLSNITSGSISGANNINTANTNPILNMQSISPALSSGQINNQINPNQIGASFSTSSISSSTNQYHANLLIPTPYISSPNNSKSKLHKKKPSQSSLISTNTNIITSVNSIQACSTNQSITAGLNTNQTTGDQNNSSNLQNEDIEIMKQRSANNNTFLCIKITEIQLLVTYKGGKNDTEKNLKDLSNVSFQFPLFEIHDQTLTWLDLVNALKSHVKKALVSQALKHKLIKVPIQPVNKLINRKRNRNNQSNLSSFGTTFGDNNVSPFKDKHCSASQQHLNDLEADEKEKLTLLKLFGTKFIEKKSQNTISIKEVDNTGRKEANKNEDEKKKSTVAKSNSTLSFDLKKRFLKFSRNNS